MKKAILEGLTEIEQNKALKQVKSVLHNLKIGGGPFQYGSYTFGITAS